MVVSIHDTPQFYRDEARSTAPPKAEFVPMFLEFVQAAVERFPEVFAWECWNEPEMYPGFDGYCGGWGIEKAGYYGQVMGKFYEAVKEVKAEAVVVFGSLMGETVSIEFLKKALAAGARCDVVGYHGYCCNWLPIIESIDAVDQMYAALISLAQRPIWLTETSCIVYDEKNMKPVDHDDNQVTWLNLVNGWKDRLFDVIIWYAAGDPQWRRAGLMEKGTLRKPVWWRLKEVNGG
jgi:hypothetical protein